MRINNGFTLLELIVTVAIAGILLAFVVPGFQGMVERNNVASTSNELLGALMYARSEAVRVESAVTLTPEADGWVVTIVSNPDIGIAADIDIVDQPVGDVNITLTNNIDGGIVTYNSRGRADSDLGDNIEVSYDDIVRNRVCLSRTGRPYIKSADEGNCP